MYTKVFTGNNAKEALAKVKQELGGDAVILTSRQIEENGVKRYQITARLEQPEIAPEAAASTGSQGFDDMRREWSDLRGHILSLLKPQLRMELLTPRQKASLEYLQREGVDEEIIVSLYRNLAAQPASSVLTVLADMIKLQPWGYGAWQGRVQAVAGPFGSGKTVTAVRMALALKDERPEARICLINADCNRGHSRLVLRHYAELSGFAYREVNSGAEIVRAIKENPGTDRFIVDLPGISCKDSLVGMLARFGLNKALVHLILSPNYAPRQIKAMLEAYQCDAVKSIIWSKLDECFSFGTLVNVCTDTRLPISALSYGPGLTDSLCAIEPSMLWKLIFKRELPKGGNIDFADSSDAVAAAAS